MKKIIVALVAFIPVSVFACGIMVFIADPNANFFTRTDDMDHASVLDWNNGFEDMWYTLKKPSSLTDGNSAVLAVTPIPADASLISVEKIIEEKLPRTAIGEQLTYLSAFNNLFSNLKESFPIVSLLLLIVAFFGSFILFGIRWYQKKKTGTVSGVVNRLTRVAIFYSLSGLVIVMFFLTRSFSMGIQKGGVDFGGNTISIPGMSFSKEDNVLVVSSHTTEEGVTLQVVRAENGVGLTAYLERNGLPKIDTNEAVFSRYIREGMNFAIVHAPAQSFGDNGRHYVHLRFPSPNLFFPLGVNYGVRDEKHVVTVLTLKPVTIPGFKPLFNEIGQQGSIFPVPIPEGNHYHRSSVEYSEGIAYYGNTYAHPYLFTGSKVYFYDTPKSYDHDIRMTIGASRDARILAWLGYSVWFCLIIILLCIVIASCIIYFFDVLPRLIKILIITPLLFLLVYLVLMHYMFQ